MIQNTCLHGFAGKTSLVPTCGKCPMQQEVAASHTGQELAATNHHNPIDSPMFIFALPDSTPIFEPELIRTPRKFAANSYTDDLPNEIFRPPRA